MEVIPAVDLKGGKVVRLTKGDPERVRTYPSYGDPLKAAKRWMQEGAKMIHVVDLDAALGIDNNTFIIEGMVKALHVDIQLGGGIRDFEKAQGLLELGVRRIILGTFAFADKEALSKLLDRYGEDRVMVALDHHGREVVVGGWRVPTKIDIRDAMRDFTRLGAKLFLTTSVTKDGTLTTPDFGVLAEVCAVKEAMVIAAGGVSRLDHVSKIRDLGAVGLVVGKALYEGRFSLGEAISIAKGG